MNNIPHSGIDYDLYRARARQLREQALDDALAAAGRQLVVGVRALGRWADKVYLLHRLTRLAGRSVTGRPKLPTLG